MRLSILIASALGLSLIVSANLALGNDVEELERKAVELSQEAREFYEKGYEEEADKLELQSQELWKKATQLARKRDSNKPDGDHRKDLGPAHPDVRHLKERLQDLRAARKEAEERKVSEQELNEIRDQISQTERKLAHLTAKRQHPEMTNEFQARVEKIENAARRLQHIRVAAENLKAAEMHDMAHELMKRADGMEQDIYAEKMELARLKEGHGGEGDEQKGENQQLRKENEELRREMHELREVIEHLKKNFAK